MQNTDLNEVWKESSRMKTHQQLQSCVLRVGRPQGSVKQAAQAGRNEQAPARRALLAILLTLLILVILILTPAPAYIGALLGSHA